MRKVLKYAIVVIVSYTIFFVCSNLYTQSENSLQPEEDQKTNPWPVRPHNAKLTSRFLDKFDPVSENLMKMYLLSGFSKPPVAQLNKQLQMKLQHIAHSANKSFYQPLETSNSKLRPSCSTDFNPELEWAPPVFYPNGQNVARMKKPDCKPEERLWKNTCCRTVYFLGGGKCGSTSLALLLKHNISNLDRFDPSSGFADGGKEPCWALASGGEKDLYNKFHDCSTSCNLSKQKTVVLDACPRYSKPVSARKIVCSNPDAKFVMLVRDPLLRTISDHNDYMIRGAGRTRRLSLHDKQTLSLRSMALSDYYSILKNFLQYVPPQNILIVQSEFLQQQNYVQHIMNEVQNHFSVPNREVRAVMSNVNSADPKYTLPSKSSFESTLTKLCSKSISFFNLVGYKFDWILSKSDKRAAQHFNSKSQ